MAAGVRKALTDECRAAGPRHICRAAFHSKFQFDEKPRRASLQQLSGRVYSVVVDPNNPIVRLCVQGMECESRGQMAEASRLFTSAWTESGDAFERCIAAHYVARHQKEAVDALMWNQRSLDYADAVSDDRVREFYPSLYLNMGKAHEDLGNRGEAKRFYEIAETLLDSLPGGRYGNIVRDAVERGLLRVRE